MATSHYITNATWRRLLTAVFAALVPLMLSAQLAGRYTTRRPLIIACDWEFPPYEFSNNSGEPDGLNVELLRTILKQMHIPHKFVMKEAYLSAADFEKHRADLIFDPVFHYRSQPYYASRSVLSYYKIKVASRTNTNAIKTFTQLGKAKRFVLKKNDYATRDILHAIAPTLQAEYRSTSEALAGVADSTFDYFAWGEEPLKWKLKELNLTDIVLNELDIPAGEIHIVGYDKELIEALDDQYARLEQNGQLEQLYNKWYHPDEVQADTSPIAVYATIIILIIVLLLLLFNRLAKRRATSATRKSDELEYMLRQAVGMSQSAVIFYDVRSGLFTSRYGNMLPDEGITQQQFMEHIHPQEAEKVTHRLDRLLSGKLATTEINIRWKPFPGDTIAKANEQAEWQYLYGHAFAEQNDDKQISTAVFAVRNVTTDMLEEQANRENSSRYTRMFETSLVAMSFYTGDGRLIDVNQNMRELCGFDEEGEKYFRQTRLFDAPNFRDELSPDRREQFYACQHMYFPELGINKYLEFRIRPILDDEGQVAYFTVSARDITSERNMDIEQRKHDRELNAATETISTYEKLLQYLLEHCDMFVWNFNLATHSITFTRSRNEVVFTGSRDDYKGWMVADEREGADQNLMEVMMKGKVFNAVHHFNHTPVNNHPCWYALSGMPAFNEQKQMTGYIGIARDVTKLMLAQERLRHETKRADESGMLKSVFLANMTHEIRTPLNAIVGFSDLLQVIEGSDDRREFIRIIRNNCDMLLRLINDIIEASNMNQGPMAIEENDVDFATAFNDICQTLAQRVEEPGVQFVVENPYVEFPTRLDKGRMQQVITNFTTNAVKYTHQGHIKVGYYYVTEQQLAAITKQDLATLAPQVLTDGEEAAQRHGIYMYCEDTGAGIPKEKQGSVFERFVKLNDYVQGTGLGLSICKSIADRYEGHIGVSSEGEGHGSTFWIWIPCPLKGKPVTR